METLLIVLALVSGLIGLAGAVLPAMPGAPLSFIGLLLLSFCDGADVSTTSLWVTGIFLVVVSVLDYVAPVWLTGASGGSEQATRGSLAGLIAGLFFFPPVGLIIGPFVGAFIGEMMASATTGKALKVALMSFVGFVFTTGMKVIYGAVLLFMIVKEAIQLIF